jgi:hypothetical protein
VHSQLAVNHCGQIKAGVQPLSLAHLLVPSVFLTRRLKLDLRLCRSVQTPIRSMASTLSQCSCSALMSIIGMHLQDLTPQELVGASTTDPADMFFTLVNSSGNISDAFADRGWSQPDASSAKKTWR